MRYLVISDIHANLEALDAVLRDVEGDYDTVLSLGDLVGYGPNPNEVVDRVRALPGVNSLAGNHDLAALGRLDLALFNDFAREAAVWTDRQLRHDVRAYLEELPTSALAGAPARAHASPRDPVWEYMEDPRQGPPNFALFQGLFCLVGHTHVPRVFIETTDETRSQVTLPGPGSTIDLADGERRIVNPGGVGQPRDGDPRAAFAVLDSESGRFTFRRVVYPIEVTQRKILDAGLPPPLAARLSYGM